LAIDQSTCEILVHLFKLALCRRDALEKDDDTSGFSGRIYRKPQPIGLCLAKKTWFPDVSYPLVI